ncbi:MAG: Do family serine endopeptidase [Nitrospirae bacterium]|nr:Do family serine endopeptidase [Nitrospirota bacterium]
MIAALAAPCGMPDSFAGLAKDAGPAVVNISTTQLVKPPATVEDPLAEQFFRKYFGGTTPQVEEKSLGSGVVISSDGYILTNNHVVANARDVRVTLPGGTVKAGEVVGGDEKTDLALIKVDASGLQAAKLGDSDSLEVGDWAVAIGNPFGLSHTVTAGIVSAKGRELGAGPYDDFIQTDASINPGNSGGPLFNTCGEVVGINTAINPAAQGIGFAIPINIAKIVAADLKAEGRVVRGWLGAGAQAITPELADAFHMKEPRGLVITSVEKGSPAAEAGLHIGDVVLSFAGREITHSSELPWLVASSKVGSKLPITVLRDGQEARLEVVIARMPGGSLTREAAKVLDGLGFRVAELTPETARQLNLDPNRTGVVVTEVASSGQAAERGMRPGDLVIAVNARAVRDTGGFFDLLQSLIPGETAAFYVQKQAGPVFVPLTVK